MWMVNRKFNWLIYTALVGLAPAILRFFVWFVSRNPSADLLNAADLMIFGLVLHISVINELQHFSDDDQRSWKGLQILFSVAFIAFYSCLLTCHLIGEFNPGLIDNQAVVLLAAVLGLASFILSYNVYNRVTNIEEV